MNKLEPRTLYRDENGFRYYTIRDIDGNAMALVIYPDGTLMAVDPVHFAVASLFLGPLTRCHPTETVTIGSLPRNCGN